jgi:hypothetical protein
MYRSNGFASASAVREQQKQSRLSEAPLQHSMTLSASSSSSSSQSMNPMFEAVSKDDPAPRQDAAFPVGSGSARELQSQSQSACDPVSNDTAGDDEDATGRAAGDGVSWGFNVPLADVLSVRARPCPCCCYVHIAADASRWPPGGRPSTEKGNAWRRSARPLRVAWVGPDGQPWHPRGATRDRPPPSLPVAALEQAGAAVAEVLEERLKQYLRWPGCGWGCDDAMLGQDTRGVPGRITEIGCAAAMYGFVALLVVPVAVQVGLAMGLLCWWNTDCWPTEDQRADAAYCCRRCPCACAGLVHRVCCCGIWAGPLTACEMQWLALHWDLAGGFLRDAPRTEASQRDRSDVITELFHVVIWDKDGSVPYELSQRLAAGEPRMMLMQSATLHAFRYSGRRAGSAPSSSATQAADASAAALTQMAAADASAMALARMVEQERGDDARVSEAPVQPRTVAASRA